MAGDVFRSGTVSKVDQVAKMQLCCQKDKRMRRKGREEKGKNECGSLLFLLLYYSVTKSQVFYCSSTISLAFSEPALSSILKSSVSAICIPRRLANFLFTTCVEPG